jgi:pimeloyl-ACP methyl ester carboxylesterase
MMLLARFSPFVRFLEKKTAGDLEKAMSRSISDPGILKRTSENTEVMELFKVVLLGGFDRMAERIAGTKNDIEISANFSCALDDIAVPTLVIHGTKDPLVPFVDHGKKLAEKIPGAKLCAVEGGEHVAIFTHRQQVRESVREFLAK